MASTKTDARALSQLNAKLATARWSEVLDHARELLTQPQTPFAACFRAMTLASEALDERWNALFFSLLWDQAAPGSEAKERSLQHAQPLPALPANSADLVAFVAELPSTWQAQPAQWLVKVLSLLRARCEESQTSATALTLMEGCVRLNKGGTRSAQQKARPLLEAVVVEHPFFLEGLSLLAQARFADGDVSGGEQALRLAVRALELPSQTSELTPIARGLKLERPSKAKLLSRLRWLLVQSNQQGQANSRICELANEELSLEGVNRREVLHHLVQATLALDRHQEALASLRALLDEGEPDEEGELHYSLAREWMRTGCNRAEAFSALRVAIERDTQRQAHGFAAKAQSEPLFEPVLQEREFLVAVHGLPSSEEVDELLATVRAKQLAGENSQALALAERAAQKAVLLEQPLMLAKALGRFAQLQTTLGSPLEAVATFHRALELREHLQSAERTTLSLGLASALHDAGQLEQAAQLYESVLDNAVRDEAATEERVLATANAWRLALQQGHLEQATQLARRLEALFRKARRGSREKVPAPALDALLDQAQTQTLSALTSARSVREREAVHERLRSLLRGYPDALPLSRSALRSLGSQPEVTAKLRKNFVALVMLPVEERVGRWSFAGKGKTLAEALTALETFAEAWNLRRSGTLLADLLANEQAIDFAVHPRSAWSYASLPLASIGPHTLVFLAEGGAPYDDFAVCVLDVPSFRGAAITRRKPRLPR